jgi:WD40 repeat protein
LFITFFSVLAKGQSLRLVLPIGHTDMISSIACSPDGRMMATGSWDNSIKIWQINSGKLLNSFQTGGDVRSIAFSPDGKYIVAGIEESSSNPTSFVELWEVNKGERVHMFPKAGAIRSVAFSENGLFFAAADAYDGPTRIWDINTFKLIKNLPTSRISLVAISPDNENIALAGYNDISIWNIRKGKIKHTFKNPGGFLNSISFSPDGRFLVAAGRVNYSKFKGWDSTICLWEVSSGKMIRTFEGHHSEVSSVVFSHDGLRLLSGSSDSTAKLWDVSSGKEVRTYHAHAGQLTCITFSQDDKYICAGGWDKTAILWRTNDSEPIRIFRGFSQQMNAIDYSSRTSLLLTGSSDSVINIWQMNNASIWKSFKSTSVVSSVAFSHDNLYAFSGAWDNTVKKWELSSGSLLFSLQGHPGRKSSIQMTDDGFPYSADKNERTPISISQDDSKVVTTDNRDGSIKLWNALSGELIDSFKNGRGARAEFVAISPNSQFILAPEGFLDPVFNIWDINAHKIVRTYKGHHATIWTASFSADGLYIVSGSWDHTIKIWDANVAGDAIKTFSGHNNDVSSVHFSPDGKSIISGSWDKSLKLWHTDNSEYHKDFFGHTGFVTSVIFTPNGKQVFSASEDNTVKLWDIETGQTIATFISMKNKSFIDSDNPKIDYLIQLPSLYYKGTFDAVAQLHYITPDLKVITFEQLDIKYNRPDKVLAAIGSTDTTLTKAYHNAYLKRVRRLGIDTSSFVEGFSLPQADIANRDSIGYDLLAGKLKLHIVGKDSSSLLDRFNVWINETPLFGSKGYSLRNRKASQLDTTITITLSDSLNIIETSVTNVNGIESYRIPLQINYIPANRFSARTYFIGIGIDKFKDSNHNLTWSVTDIRNLANSLKAKYKGDIKIDTLFNGDVTIDNVKALKDSLSKTAINDKVILAYSGHGLLSDSFDYYLSTYNVNFNKPEEGGLLYDVLEDLLDGIPARKKLVLLDACHSGEVDKEEMQHYKQVQAKLNSDIKGTIVENRDSSKLGMQNSFELMQQLFVNVGRSTGATIISAAAGTQFALEKNLLKDGVFTYSILEYMKEHASCTVTELKEYVNNRVSELTDGLQQPTARNENLHYDWIVW